MAVTLINNNSIFLCGVKSRSGPGACECQAQGSPRATSSAYQIIPSLAVQFCFKEALQFDGCFSHFQFVVLMNKAAVYIFVQVFLLEVGIRLDKKPRNEDRVGTQMHNWIGVDKLFRRAFCALSPQQLALSAFNFSTLMGGCRDLLRWFESAFL